MKFLLVIADLVCVGHPFGKKERSNRNIKIFRHIYTGFCDLEIF